MQDGARNFQGAIDGGRADTRRNALRNQRRQSGVVHLMRLQVADVLDEQPNMSVDGLQAAHVLRLRQVALRAVRESRAPGRSARQVEVHLLHLSLQALFGLFLSDRADAHADANAAVALVDEEPSVAAAGDAGGAGRTHGVPPFSQGGAILRIGGEAGARGSDARPCSNRLVRHQALHHPLPQGPDSTLRGHCRKAVGRDGHPANDMAGSQVGSGVRASLGSRRTLDRLEFVIAHNHPER